MLIGLFQDTKRWLCLSDSVEYKEWKKTIIAEFGKGDTQDEMYQIITQRPEEFRQMIEQIEMRAMDSDDKEEMTSDELLRLESNVEKRMLKESPALREHKVTLQDSKLVPDFSIYDRETRRKKDWLLLSKKE